MWDWLNQFSDHALGVWGLFLAVCAGIGVGSIIAAWIGRDVSISQHRQAWIDALRDDLAEYLKEMDVLYHWHAELNGNSKHSSEVILENLRKGKRVASTV
jgi:uncharacterized membrane-anchored protein YhcB (DUF1043 family)